MPRASAAFRKVGFQVIPAPADFQTGDDEGLLPRILPAAGSLANSELALKEWLGLLVYIACVDGSGPIRPRPADPLLQRAPVTGHDYHALRLRYAYPLHPGGDGKGPL